MNALIVVLDREEFKQKPGGVGIEAETNKSG
jgi:hypothetical protein